MQKKLVIIISIIFASAAVVAGTIVIVAFGGKKTENDASDNIARDRVFGDTGYRRGNRRRKTER